MKFKKYLHNKNLNFNYYLNISIVFIKQKSSCEHDRFIFGFINEFSIIRPKELLIKLLVEMGLQ